MTSHDHDQRFPRHLEQEHDMTSKPTVAVLAGGLSHEREISLRSG